MCKCVFVTLRRNVNWFRHAISYTKKCRHPLSLRAGAGCTSMLTLARECSMQHNDMEARKGEKWLLRLGFLCCLHKAGRVPGDTVHIFLPKTLSHVFGTT